MADFTLAIFLPEDKNFEEAYHNVVGEEDNIEFDHSVENSKLFKESYASYQETYVKWYNTEPDKRTESIIDLIGYEPKVPAVKSFIGSVYVTKIVTGKDYYDRLLYANKTKNYSEFYIPASFINDNLYHKNLIETCEITTPDGNMTITEPGYYDNLFLEFLRQNKDRLIVICKCRN